jgi:hypothetical protein
MANYENEKNPNNDVLLDRIQSLERRLTNIESMLRIEWAGEKKAGLEEAPGNEIYTSEETESTVIENGLAWLGSIVLVFGIIFLMNYMDNLGFPLMSRLIAYTLTFTLIAFVYYQRKSFSVLVNVISIFSPLLIFYITLSLYVTAGVPIIENQFITLMLLLMVAAGQLWMAIRRDNELYASISIIIAAATAITLDNTFILFGLSVVISLVTIILFYKKLWWKALFFSLFIVYITHFLWLFGNPIMGNQMRLVENPQYNVLFLFAYGVIYASSIFLPKAKQESNGVLISIAVWNALLFTLLLFIILAGFYKDNYALICSAIAIFCLGFSIILKIKSTRLFAPATYACFGFMAMSMAVYGFAGLPNTYFLLVLQSFLVVSMALWFRSKIIVVANSFLFTIIWLLYLTTAEGTDLINFTFAITALATARILNWKKERLTLKTEIFRNVFLAIAFIMVLYAFSKALPSQFVTLTWTAAAITFFVFSIWLKNVKYRYLSILTIVVTGGHLFFIDLGQMEIGYRVIAFMVFAVISIGVSIYYAKRKQMKT